MWAVIKKQNELENVALVNDEYAKVSAINQIKNGYMASIQRLQAALGQDGSDAAALSTVNKGTELPPTGEADVQTEFVTGKLRGLMQQAESLLRRCTSHGASSNSITAAAEKRAAKLPGPPKISTLSRGKPESSTTDQTKHGKTSGAGANGEMTGFGSSIQTQPDEETSFCTCTIS